MDSERLESYPTILSYAPDTTVELVAVPSPGFTFVEWNGDMSDNGNHSISLVLTCDKAVTAIFVPVQSAFTWWWLVAGISAVIVIIITFPLSLRFTRSRFVKR